MGRAPAAARLARPVDACILVHATHAPLLLATTPSGCSAANAMRPSSAATVPLAMVPTEAAVSPCTATAASIDDAVACAAAGCAGSSGGSPPPVASGGAVSASPRRRRSESVDAGCAAAVAYGEEEEEEEGEGGVPGEELTLEFLETNGYFDMPIQVSHTFFESSRGGPLLLGTCLCAQLLKLHIPLHPHTQD